MDQHLQPTGVSSELVPDLPPVTGPFVINLCSSPTPIELKSASLPGLERFRVFQVRRVEDSRPRYRLRLGFFADEAAAEVVLDAIRRYYPAALCVAAGSDDLKHAPGFDTGALGLKTGDTGRFQRPSVPTAPAPQKRAAATPPSAPAVTAPSAAGPTATVAAALGAPAATGARKAPEVPPTTLRTPPLTLQPDPPPRHAAAPPASDKIAPFRVKPADAQAMEKATASLKLHAEVQASGARTPSIAPPKLVDGPILIDSTQTLRLLTETELADTQAPPWFAVQVAVSDQPINLDTMPKLDIFQAFRLYSIAMTQQGRIQHSLRLGFFRESVSAEAVCGYLKTFFGEPSVLRVSAAEQARFAEPPSRPVLHETATRSAEVVRLPVTRASTAPDAGTRSGAQPKGTPKPAVTKPRSAAPKVAPTVPATNPPAARAATAVTTRSAPLQPKRNSSKKQSLSELLQQEARDVELSESGIRRMEQKRSLLSKLVGKLTR